MPTTEPPIVRDCMTAQVPIVGPANDAFEALRALRKSKAPAALVIEEGRGIVGVFTEKSALQILANTAYDRLPGGRVSDYMQVSPDAVSPNTDLFQVARTFLDTDVTALPVIEDGRLVGAITRPDLVAAIEKLQDYLAAEEGSWDRNVKAALDPESKEEMQPYLANARPEQRAESMRNRKTLQARDERKEDLPK